MICCGLPACRATMQTSNQRDIDENCDYLNVIWSPKHFSIHQFFENFRCQYSILNQHRVAISTPFSPWNAALFVVLKTGGIFVLQNLLLSSQELSSSRLAEILLFLAEKKIFDPALDQEKKKKGKGREKAKIRRRRKKKEKRKKEEERRRRWWWWKKRRRKRRRRKKEKQKNKKKAGFIVL